MLVLHPVSKSASNKLRYHWVSNQLFKQTIHLIVENKVHKRIHINECKYDTLTPSLSPALSLGLTKNMVHHFHHQSSRLQIKRD